MELEIYFSHLDMSGFLIGGLAWSRGTVSEGWSSLSGGAGGRPGEPLTSDGDPVTSPPCEIFKLATEQTGIASHDIGYFLVLYNRI